MAVPEADFDALKRSYRRQLVQIEQDSQEEVAGSLADVPKLQLTLL